MIGTRAPPRTPTSVPCTRSVAYETAACSARSLIATPFESDAEARQVHHNEHVFEPAMLLADQMADRAAGIPVSQHRRRARVDAELVLDRDTAHIVARAEAAILIDEEFRHDEQRDPLHPLRGVRRPREHEMDDVVSKVVLAVGDENLLAKNAVMVAFRDRPRTNGREIGAGRRLGEIHRPGPDTLDHLRQVERLLRLGTTQRQRLDGAARQQRAQRERHVGGVPHLVHRRRDDGGQSLSAVCRTASQRVPAAGDEFFVGIAEPVRRGDGAVVPARALGITALVQRRQHLASEPRRLVENRVDQLLVVNADHLVQHETNIAQRRGIGHLARLLVSTMPSFRRALVRQGTVASIPDRSTSLRATGPPASWRKPRRRRPARRKKPTGNDGTMVRTKTGTLRAIIAHHGAPQCMEADPRTCSDHLYSGNAFAASRRANFCIFPVEVLGISRKTKRLGTL